MKTLLFTGSGGANSSDYLNIFHRKYKFRVLFGDIDLENISTSIPSSCKIQMPNPQNKNFCNKLISIIKTHKIDIVIPTVDEEIHKIKNDNHLMSLSFLPNKNFINNTMNKFKLYENLKRQNFLTPITYQAKKEIKISSKKKYLIKPKLGRGSRGVVEIKNYKQFNAYFNLEIGKIKDCIVQEKIKGTEYTINVYCDNNNKLINILPLKIIKKKGITINGVIDNNKKIIKFVEEFAGKFKTNNIYNLQIILNKKGVYCFEVNPRISTTSVILFSLGINPFSKKLIKKINIKNDIYFKRFWENFILNHEK